MCFLCISPKAERLSAAQDEEEVASEKPAKKQTREEDVFAGNKNLRSEDQKFREMHDDRLACQPLSSFARISAIDNPRQVTWMIDSRAHLPGKAVHPRS